MMPHQARQPRTAGARDRSHADAACAQKAEETAAAAAATAAAQPAVTIQMAPMATVAPMIVAPASVAPAYGGGAAMAGYGGCAACPEAVPQA